MLIRKLSAATAALGLFGIAAPVAGASAATTPAASVPPALAPPLLTFVPPKVGPLTVNIGNTIIGGKVISPGVHVSTPGVSVPLSGSTLPAVAWNPSVGASKAPSKAPS